MCKWWISRIPSYARVWYKSANKVILSISLEGQGLVQRQNKINCLFIIFFYRGRVFWIRARFSRGIESESYSGFSMWYSHIFWPTTNIFEHRPCSLGFSIVYLVITLIVSPKSIKALGMEVNFPYWNTLMIVQRNTYCFFKSRVTI
jgi:hypothetical protein